ncbi:MAG TPA: DEAD/DEAH box helicase [Dongiaceae bacterium]|nr:DEAD/DEAH box helicase [Dongiaceae bacterium]
MSSYKTEPRPYQRLVVDKTYKMPALALFLKQGLGKSKVTLDTAAHLFAEGEIECLIVMSKTSVVENWFLEEVPLHLGVAHESYLYSTKRKNKIPPPGRMPQGVLKVIMINDGCSRTVHGFKFLSDLVAKYQCMIAVDESTLIKNPTATITKRMLKLAEKCKYRRVLCGEPAPQGPVDYYSQYKFLDPKILNVGTYTAYKSMFCEQEPIWINGRQILRPTGGFTMTGKEAFEAAVKPFTIRLRKEDVLDDLPEKQYVTRRFYLPDDVQRMYDKLANDFMTELVIAEGAGTLTATLAISRATRLHQIVAGHAPNDDQTVFTFDSGKYSVLQDILDERPEGSKTIIWAHYRATIDDLTERLEKDYGPGCVARIYGGITENDRQDAVKRFKTRPNCRFLVANPASAGWGLTFVEADACVYYSNSYNWEHRDQSEDRIHRIGQKNAVTYYDIVAQGTVEEKIMEVLGRKGDFSKSVLTNYSEWFARKR